MAYEQSKSCVLNIVGWWLCGFKGIVHINSWLNVCCCQCTFVVHQINQQLNPSIITIMLSMRDNDDTICAHPAQRILEVDSINFLPDNFFIHVVKMSKKMCNLGSLLCLPS